MVNNSKIRKSYHQIDTEANKGKVESPNSSKQKNIFEKNDKIKNNEL